MVNSLRDAKFSINIHASMLAKLMGLITSLPVLSTSWNHIKGLPLADPDFAIPGEIDLIIRADLCGHLFLGKRCTGSLNEPTGCSTPFGWVLMGSADVKKWTAGWTHLVTVLVVNPESKAFEITRISKFIRRIQRIFYIALPRCLLNLTTTVYYTQSATLLGDQRGIRWKTLIQGRAAVWGAFEQDFHPRQSRAVYSTPSLPFRSKQKFFAQQAGHSIRADSL